MFLPACLHGWAGFKIGTMKSRTITLCGKEVEVIYCAATETGFETLRDKSMGVFAPDEGKATTEDYIALGFVGIIAAYTRRGEDVPITSADILYDATPAEVQSLIVTILELRNEWYQVPSIVKPESKQGKRKN